ncbi:hypothetical protein IFM89_015929, partial [Coptis chinensis]
EPRLNQSYDKHAWEELIDLVEQTGVAVYKYYHRAPVLAFIYSIPLLEIQSIPRAFEGNGPLLCKWAKLEALHWKPQLPLASHLQLPTRICIPSLWVQQGVFNPYLGQQYLQIYGVPSSVNAAIYPYGQSH